MLPSLYNYTKNICIFELKSELGKKTSLLIDRFLNILWCNLTGYGVKVHRILYPLLSIWIIGYCIFGNEDSYSVYPSSAQPKPAICQPHWMSLNFLLPIVKLPTVDKCMPSHEPIWEETSIKTVNTILKEIPAMEKYNFVKKESIKIPVINTMSFADFAIVETVVGWLLIPVGIAGLTGVLKR